jgi:hypothetical protein
LEEDYKDSNTYLVNDEEVIILKDDDDDDDNSLSFKDDDDDWCNRTDREYEEDGIIHQAHGGGECFEDGTTDDVNGNDDEQECIVRSYYSNSFNILEDVCLKIASKIKCRVEGKFQDNVVDVQELYPNSSAACYCERLFFIGTELYF